MKICNETGVFMEKKRTVIKVGTSTLTYENGKINYRRVEQLCKVLSDLQNRGEQVIFVSSGAIAVGMGKAGLDKRPTETKKKQALAAIGQCELMTNFSASTTTLLLSCCLPATLLKQNRKDRMLSTQLTSFSE